MLYVRFEWSKFSWTAYNLAPASNVYEMLRFAILTMWSHYIPYDVAYAYWCWRFLDYVSYRQLYGQPISQPDPGTYKHFARYIQVESEMTLFIFCHVISNHRGIIYPSNHHRLPNVIFDTLGVSDLIKLGFSWSRLLHLYRLLSHTQMRSLGF